MQKLIIAPDSYKESLSAFEVAKTISKAFKRVHADIETICLPLADGGEGTVDAFLYNLKGQKIEIELKDPLGRAHKAYYGWIASQKLAIIEMAQASGLPLLAIHERNPLITDSFGTGQLIIDALEKGAKTIILGLGGSATNDGGQGMMRALGAVFTDENSKEIEAGGVALQNLYHINLDNLHPKIKDVEFHIACDVNNPLCGERGASAVFGPQKGASAEVVVILDKALQNYAHIIQKTLGKNIHSLAGAGAAGGMGAAFYAFFPHITFEPGIDIICHMVNIDKHMENADLAITGEGRMDFQTLSGKTPMGVVRSAQKYNVPVIAINGSLGQDYGKLLENGFTAIFDTTISPSSLEDALKNTEENLYNMALSVAQIYAKS